MISSTNLPELNSDAKSLSSFFNTIDTQKLVKSKERRLMKLVGISDKRTNHLKAVEFKPKQKDFFVREKTAIHNKTRKQYLLAADYWERQAPKLGGIATQIQMMQERIDRARTKWACITAKSQRQKNYRFKNGAYFLVNTYQNMTEIKPKIERDRGIKPPERSGEIIHRFTKRSRQRMMARARKLNRESMKLNMDGKRKKIDKSLPIPYFVTLTYRKNFQDCEAAKKHLNAFFQRWRRRGEDFAYFWKMEPQKRGAVHFHVAMFLPEGWQRMEIDYIDFPLNLSKKNSEKFSEDHKRLMKIISSDWAEVTKKVDGYKSRYSKIKYFLKGGGVSKASLDEREGWHVDYQHLRFGTNVRKCENWKMFLAYIYKYMEKEVERNNPLTALKKRKIVKSSRRKRGFNKFDGKAAAQVFIEEIKEYNKTGRWWGFSYNLDFDALQTGYVDNEDKRHMNDFCNLLNLKTFLQVQKQCVENAKRARKNLGGRQLEKRLQHIRNTYEAQKRRYLINQDKIKEGYLMQFEIEAATARKYRRYLKEKDFSEIFADLKDSL